MKEPSNCPECGAVVPPGGSCVNCLLRLSLNPPLANGSGAEATPAAQDLASERIGPYRLMQKLGEGGMGTVWMAEQTEPIRRIVALKIIQEGRDSTRVLARFEAERQALALMDHPNIAKVLDAGSTPTGRPYFVMELVKGVPLTQFCDERHLSIRERLELFIAVCQAIQHAHQKGIIHRDIKPSNVLVALYDAEPVPKVIDFGIAKATGHRLTERTLFTQFGALVGTPEYMSPEQAELNQLDIDTRSDIYSLGVLLYELLTGTTPLGRADLAKLAFDQVLRCIREQEPQKPSTRLSQRGDQLPSISAQRKLEPAHLLKALRGDLDWVVMKALEKERQRRYETANTLANDLRCFLANEPVAARPPTTPYRLGKFVRRNKGLVAAVTTVILTLVISAGLSIWQAKRATRAERLAGSQRRLSEDARKKAEAKANEVRAALATSDFLQAIHLVEQDDAPLAVAHLVRCLRLNPSHRSAATRLVTLLSQRVWPRQLTSPLRLGSEIDSVHFSADGRLALASSSDGTARVWDVQTGRPVTELRHYEVLNSAYFSADGTRVVTASINSTARVWDAQTGQPVTEPLKHDNPVQSARFSKDGRRVVTASPDGTARVWDTRTGQPVTEPLEHPGAVYDARFDPEGHSIVTVGGTTAQVWNVETGQPLIAFEDSGSSIISAQFSPGGKRLVTVSWDGTVRVWDVQTGQDVTEPLKHKSRVSRTRYSPGGKRLVTESLDVQTGQEVAIPLKHRNKVSVAQFSPDGKRVVTASADNTARVWSVESGQPLTEPLRHHHEVRSAQFSPNGKCVLTASADGSARMWDVQSRFRRAEPIKYHRGRVGAFSSDNGRMVTLGRDGTARIWSLETGRPLTEPIGHEDEIRAALLSPDGKWVLTASSDTARVWNVDTAQKITELNKRNGVLLPFAFSRDSKRLLMPSASNAVQVCDVQTGQPVTEPLKHRSRVSVAQFSPDGTRVVTAGAGTARVWDVQTGELLAETLKQDGVVRSAQFSPESKRLVTASSSAAAWVWNAQTGELLTEPLKHKRDVLRATFSRDGKRIATASADGTARVWDSQTGRPLTEPLKHHELVWSAEFDPEGDRVVTASQDGAVQVWDVATGRALSDPLAHKMPVSRAEFSIDGKRLLTTTLEGAYVWDLAPARGSCPEWLLMLAEAMSGQTLGPNGLIQSVDVDQMLPLVRTFLMNAPDDDWATLGRWLFADPDTRTISPFSNQATQSLLKALEADAGKIRDKYQRDADSGDIEAHNSLAWILATSEYMQVRDGQKAVAYALKAVEATFRSDHTYLDTLAAAYAEAGQFEKAIATQKCGRSREWAPKRVVGNGAAKLRSRTNRPTV